MNRFQLSASSMNMFYFDNQGWNSCLDRPRRLGKKEVRRKREEVFKWLEMSFIIACGIWTLSVHQFLRVSVILHTVGVQMSPILRWPWCANHSMQKYIKDHRKSKTSNDKTNVKRRVWMTFNLKTCLYCAVFQVALTFIPGTDLRATVGVSGHISRQSQDWFCVLLYRTMRPSSFILTLPPPA